MKCAVNHSWGDLFTPEATASVPGVTRNYRVLRKRGEPLLLLPDDGNLAARALSLYPAQSLLARCARGALGVAFRSGLLAAATERGRIPSGTGDAFADYIRQEGGTESLPRLAILAGNPRVAGRRFLILVFGSAGRPLVAVKAGVGEAAKALIAREAALLKAISPATPGIPRLRSTFRSDRLDAFALDFITGHSPREKEVSRLAGLLTAWLDTGPRIGLAELACWQRLRAACAGNPWLPGLDSRLANLKIQTALGHGDLAPWNTKVVAGGDWVVLDWERGELRGPPGWDWFHYLVQPAILVERISAARLSSRVEALFASAPFVAYREAAGLAGGAERAWFLAYLLYCCEVVKPAEGLLETRSLLETLGRKWLN